MTVFDIFQQWYLIENVFFSSVLLFYEDWARSAGLIKAIETGIYFVMPDSGFIIPSIVAAARNIWGWVVIVSKRTNTV